MSNLLEILRAEGLVDEAGIGEADRLRREQGVPLPTALVRAGAATERAVAVGLARQKGMPFVDTAPGNVDPAAAALVPRSLALQLQALPVAFNGPDELVVAVSRPDQVDAANRITEVTGMRVTVALAAGGELARAIEHLAGDADGRPGAGDRGRAQPGPGTEAAAPASAGPEWSADHLLAYEQETGMDLDEVLTTLVERGGSDLHLTSGSPPAVRVRGELVRLEEYGELTPPELQKMIYSILTQRQREAF